MRAFSGNSIRLFCVLLVVVQLLVTSVAALPIDTVRNGEREAEVALRSGTQVRAQRTPHRLEDRTITNRPILARSIMSVDGTFDVASQTPSRKDRFRTWYRKRLARITDSLTRLRSKLGRTRGGVVRNDAAIATAESSPDHVAEVHEDAAMKQFVPKPVFEDMVASAEPQPRQALPARPWLPAWSTEASTSQHHRLPTWTSGEFRQHDIQPDALQQTAAAADDAAQKGKALAHSESFHSARADPLTPLASSPGRTPLAYVHKQDEDLAHAGQRNTVDSPDRSSVSSLSSDDSQASRKRRPGTPENVLASAAEQDIEEPLTVAQRKWRKFTAKASSPQLIDNVATVAEKVRSVPHLVRRDDRIVYEGLYPGESIRVQPFGRGSRAEYHFVHVNAINAPTRSAPWGSLTPEFKRAVTQAIRGARDLGKGRATPEELGIRVSEPFAVQGHDYPYPGREAYRVKIVQRNGEHYVQLFTPSTRVFVTELASDRVPQHLSTWIFQHFPHFGRFLLRRDIATDLEFRSVGEQVSLHKRDPHIVLKEWYSGDYISVRQDRHTGQYVFQFETAKEMFFPVRAAHWNELSFEERRLAQAAIPNVDELVAGRKTAQELNVKLTDSFRYYDQRGYVWPGQGPQLLTALDYGGGNIVFERRSHRDDAAPFATESYDKLPKFLQKYVDKYKPELTTVFRPRTRWESRRPSLEAGSSSSSSSSGKARAPSTRPSLGVAVTAAQGARDLDPTGQIVIYPGEKLRIIKETDKLYRVSHNYAGETTASKDIRYHPSYAKLEGELKSAVDSVAPHLNRLARGKPGSVGKVMLADGPNDPVNAYDYPGRNPELVQLVSHNGKAAFLRTDMTDKTPVGGLVGTSPKMHTWSELPNHIKGYLLNYQPMFLDLAKSFDH